MQQKRSTDTRLPVRPSTGSLHRPKSAVLFNDDIFSEADALAGIVNGKRNDQSTAGWAVPWMVERCAGKRRFIAVRASRGRHCFHPDFPEATELETSDTTFGSFSRFYFSTIFVHLHENVNARLRPVRRQA